MNTKRIALMTWHHTENYGTALQAYALKTIVEELNCTVDLIEYRRSYDGPPRVRPVSRILKEKLCGFFHRRTQSARDMYSFNPHTFLDFWESFFSYTPPCASNQDFEKLCGSYHGFICGSDQIWGPEWFDSRYFLDFVAEPSRKIAYAPSFGVSQLEDAAAARSIGCLICDFAALSVREKSGCAIAERITGRKDVRHVLDPVLLLDAQRWRALADERVRLPAERYMFIFFLKNNADYFCAAIEKAGKLGLIPIVMHSTQSEDNSFANLDGPIPRELLAYIRSAAYVCTDSFHMTVLSVLFNVPFQVFQKYGAYEANEKNGRILDLLERLSIQGHIYRKGLFFDDAIDYKYVNRTLEQLRAESIAFLRQAIEQLPDNLESQGTMERECAHENNCRGELSRGFLRRWNGEGGPLERRLMDKMRPWNFALEDKCYRCCFFRPDESCANLKKPLFYDDLIADLEDERISIWRIYRQYYFSFALLHKLGNLRKRSSGRNVFRELTTNWNRRS